MFEEIPSQTRLYILKNFLFADFFIEFDKFFEMEMPSDDPKIQHSFYRWGNDEFDEFMIEVMKGLVPRKYSYGQIIYQELDDIIEMTFVM